MSPTNRDDMSDWDAGLDEAKLAHIAVAGECKMAWRQAREADKDDWGAELDDKTMDAIASEHDFDHEDLDDATAATIAAAEARRNLSTAVKMAMAEDPSRSPPTRRGGFQDHPPIPKPLPQTPQPRLVKPAAETVSTPTTMSMAHYVTKYATKGEESRTPPASSSALTLAEAQAIGPWMTWTLFPDAKVRLTPRPLPMEELSPPPLPSNTPSAKALGKRKL